MSGYITYLITAAAIAMIFPLLIYILFGGILQLLHFGEEDKD